MVYDHRTSPHDRRGPTSRRTVGSRRAAIFVMLGMPAAGLLLAAQKQLELISVERETAATREQADRYERMVEILGSQQLMIRSMAPATSQPEARAVVYLDPSSGGGVLTVRRALPRASGRALQLWCARGEKLVRSEERRVWKE